MMGVMEPSWISVLPPVVAIGLAIAFRQVIVALLAGVWLGAFFLADFDPVAGLLRSVDTYALSALAHRDHASVVIFTLLLGGMVGVVARSGGGAGLAEVVTRFATNSRRGQTSTWLLGLLIFFDDFANTLLVGSTMRPITDKLKVSREKLAFIVDATAAPVASIAVISSWIGMEIGLIADQYRALGIEGDAYIVFVQTIPYRFYPILMLVFGFLIAASRRDFGPMLRAERRALFQGKLLADGAKPAASFEDASLAPIEGKPRRWINAAVPILTTIVVIVLGMYFYGRAVCQNGGLELTLKNIFAKADSYKALLWAGLIGGMLAIGMSMIQRICNLREAMEAWLQGVKSMVLAMVILVLAWSLGAVCKDLKTADFIIQAIGGWLSPALLPALVFLVSALVSFATGTSWGTMGILFPLVVPLAHKMAPGQEAVMLGTISSILAGAVWGDHCSPISDTTIMSSMASSCDHIDHVRTQIPYALAVGLVCLIFGDLACGLGVYSAWVGLLVGAGLLAGVVLLVGKRADA
jgi:Na+/H+ antiporter NhaC